MVISRCISTRSIGDQIRRLIDEMTPLWSPQNRYATRNAQRRAGAQQQAFRQWRILEDPARFRVERYGWASQEAVRLQALAFVPQAV